MCHFQSFVKLSVFICQHRSRINIYICLTAPIWSCLISNFRKWHSMTICICPLMLWLEDTFSLKSIISILQRHSRWKKNPPCYSKVSLPEVLPKGWDLKPWTNLPSSEACHQRSIMYNHKPSGVSQIIMQLYASRKVTIGQSTHQMRSGWWDVPYAWSNRRNTWLHIWAMTMRSLLFRNRFQLGQQIIF